MKNHNKKNHSQEVLENQPNTVQERRQRQTSNSCYTTGRVGGRDFGIAAARAMREHIPWSLGLRGSKSESLQYS